MQLPNVEGMVYTHDGRMTKYMEVSNDVILPRERLSAIYSAGRIKKSFVAC